jgi:hypothetical protein
MRNTVKPVPPPGGFDDGNDIPLKKDGAAFDDEDASGVRRERGDAVDPAGPKRVTAAGLGVAKAVVDDPSGTTGTVSRSNDRLSTTTGKLGDRDLERSSRMSAEPDVDALPTVRDASGYSAPLLMATLAGLLAVMSLLWFAGCFSTDPVEDDAPTLRNLQNEIE